MKKIVAKITNILIFYIFAIAFFVPFLHIPRPLMRLYVDAFLFANIWFYLWLFDEERK